MSSLKNESIKRIQLSCGPYPLSGWSNYDRDVDISKPLPFKNDSIELVYIEHGIEHISQTEVLSFLKEVHRILKVSGIVRIAFPDMTRIRFKNDAAYNDKFGDGTLIGSMFTCATDWGHKSFWNFDLMYDVCMMSELVPDDRNYACGQSSVPELQNVEQHWRTSSKALVELETSIIECHKCL